MYKLIAVEGPDALGFLQGQLTQDVALVGTSAPLPAAWCNPKGRVFVTLQLVSTDDGYGLIVPAAMAERVIQRLTLYRLRARVRIEPASDRLPAGIETDPVALIRAGVATIDDTNSEDFTPHMLNLDKRGAISFDKGCYTGQEVVARTEHLGKSKRRAMRYQADAAGITVGDKLSDGERNVGEVVNVAGRDLLAVTPIELHDRTLCCGNTTVTPMPLPYGL